MDRSGARRRAAVAAAIVAAALVAPLAASSAPVGAQGADPYFTRIDDPTVRVDGRYRPITGRFTDLLLDDIIWYAPGDAVDHRWTPCPGCPQGRFTKAPLVPQVRGDFDPIVGDFAGDGLDDIFWRNRRGGADHLWTNAGAGSFTSRRLDISDHYDRWVLLSDSRGGPAKDAILWRSDAVGTLPLWEFPDDGSGAARTVARLPRPAGEPYAGDFDGNGAVDVLWYDDPTPCIEACSPAGRPDALWWRSPDAAGIERATTLDVRGTYVPVPGDLVGGDERADILWLGVRRAWRTEPTDGPDSLWAGTASGRFVARPAEVPTPGRALVLDHDGTDAVLLAASGALSVWHDSPAGPIIEPAGFGDEIYGATPVVGRFTSADVDDVLEYRPGPGAERLFHHEP